MIGTRLRVAPGPSVFGLLGVIGGIGLVGVGIYTQNAHWAVGGALPLLVGLALLLTGDSGYELEFQPTGVTIHETSQAIPFASLQGMCFSGSPHGPLDLLFEERCLRIAGRNDQPQASIYQFFVSQLTPTGSRNVNGKMQGHLQQQLATFGDDKVFSFRARSQYQPPSVYRRQIAVSLMLVLCGIVWIGGGIPLQKGHDVDPYVGFGCLLLICGGLAAACYASFRKPLKQIVKNWQAASLVISPLGIALIQGDLQGEMKWRELQEAKLVNKAPATARHSCHRRSMLTLTVPGATIRIPDIYDRPLTIIHERIMAYWR